VTPRIAIAMSAALCAAVTAGCRDVPPTTPKTFGVQVPTDPRTDGDAAAQRGDWATAAARYGEAVQRTPNDVLLRFALGSALSHLDRTADAVEHFVWVVDNGSPTTVEVASARQWLRDVGALPANASTPAAQTASATNGAAPEVSATGTLSGKTAWPGLDRHTSLRLRLRGQTEATKAARDRVTIPLGKPFTFSKVTAGEYRLVGEAAGVALWDVPITVEADKTTSVDLSPANSSVPAAGFPPRG